MVYGHEQFHSFMTVSGVPDPGNKFYEKYSLYAKKNFLNNTTPSRDISTTNSNYKYYGGSGRVYSPSFSNKLFNIIR
jgi:hypothetical protein